MIVQPGQPVDQVLISDLPSPGTLVSSISNNPTIITH